MLREKERNASKNSFSPPALPQGSAMNLFESPFKGVPLDQQIRNPTSVRAATAITPAITTATASTTAPAI